MKPNTAILLASGLALLVLVTAAAPARADCPPYLKTVVGGDYNDAEDRQGLALIEPHHFTPDVENLRHGSKSYLGGDLSYTLEHYPNHHRALSSMAKLVLRDKNVKPTGAKFNIECYFQRALGYRPKDAKVHAIYAGFLLAQNQLDLAREHLATAVQLEPDNATSHYNLGLLYIKNKDYAAARESAQRAYALGFPLPGLRNKLQQAGQWQQ
ncbi:tetratricopeptide repeat protein [Pseudoduganella aquatica]|uniref:tetratricopeptide repeat protein n=1 Tax=Pseudoduganella aquatica TaxID=2660641 RepID=UPI001E3BDF2C|nr:tetratricopeptide repeat protein [Pseudoduganella aquatica]